MNDWQRSWIEHCLQHPMWFDAPDWEIADFLANDRGQLGISEQRALGVTDRMVRSVRATRRERGAW